MRRVELTFLLVGIDRESLQEIFIYTSYKVVIGELLGIYLVNLVHHAFQNPRFKGRFRENLLRQGIFQFRLIVVQRLYGCIESDGHTGRSRKNKLVPERLICQEEHAVLHILIGTGQLHFNKSLVVNALNLHNLVPDFILLLLEPFPYEFQEHKSQQ